MIESRGGLVTLISRDAAMFSITLMCATHSRAWKVGHRFYVGDLAGTDRVDVLTRASDLDVHLARHRLDSCRCASPLFDDEFTNVDGTAKE